MTGDQWHLSNIVRLVVVELVVGGLVAVELLS